VTTTLPLAAVAAADSLPPEFDEGWRTGATHGRVRTTLLAGFDRHRLPDRLSRGRTTGALPAATIERPLAELNSACGPAATTAVEEATR
jgi:hypothetical protein